MFVVKRATSVSWTVSPPVLCSRGRQSPNESPRPVRRASSTARVGSAHGDGGWLRPLVPLCRGVRRQEQAPEPQDGQAPGDHGDVGRTSRHRLRCEHAAEDANPAGEDEAGKAKGRDGQPRDTHDSAPSSALDRARASRTRLRISNPHAARWTADRSRTAGTRGSPPDRVRFSRWARSRTPGCRGLRSCRSC